MEQRNALQGTKRRRQWVIIDRQERVTDPPRDMPEEAFHVVRRQMKGTIGKPR